MTHERPLTISDDLPDLLFRNAQLGLTQEKALIAAEICRTHERPASPAVSDQLNGKTPWEFACAWYTVDQIEYSIKNRWRTLSATMATKIPRDVDSPEFAAWLTEQYRLAMAKGIEIGQRSSENRRLRLALSTQQHEIEQTLGKALGYPKFTEDELAPESPEIPGHFSVENKGLTHDLPPEISGAIVAVAAPAQERLVRSWLSKTALQQGCLEAMAREAWRFFSEAVPSSALQAENRRLLAQCNALDADFADTKSRFCEHHRTPGAVGPGCPECERTTARETIARLQSQLDKAWLEGGDNELTRGDLLGIMVGQRDAITRLERELDEARTRVTSLLFSPAAESLTCGEVQKWRDEYSDERESLKATITELEAQIEGMRPKVIVGDGKTKIDRSHLIAIDGTHVRTSWIALKCVDDEDIRFAVTNPSVTYLDYGIPQFHEA